MIHRAAAAVTAEPVTGLVAHKREREKYAQSGEGDL